MIFICSQGEHARCHRLLAVLEFLHRQGPCSFDVFDDIAALEDGGANDLIVHWLHPPSRWNEFLCDLVWRDLGGPEGTVVHELGTEPEADGCP